MYIRNCSVHMFSSQNIENEIINPIKEICQHLDMLSAINEQRDCLEFYEKVIRSFIETFPDSPIQNTFETKIVATTTCLKCGQVEALA